MSEKFPNFNVEQEKISEELNRLREEAHAQEKPIPELTIHETSPSLGGEAVKVLKEQWEKFWQLRFAKRENEVSEEVAQNFALLKAGTLLHNLRYDEVTLSKILQSGILSGELGYSEKDTRAEDAETHYCADFFVNQGDKSIQEYIEYAYGNEENVGNLKKKRMESFSCPREQNDNISVVVDSSKPELADLLQYSATGVDASGMHPFLRTYFST